MKQPKSRPAAKPTRLDDEMDLGSISNDLGAFLQSYTGTIKLTFIDTNIANLKRQEMGNFGDSATKLFAVLDNHWSNLKEAKNLPAHADCDALKVELHDTWLDDEFNALIDAHKQDMVVLDANVKEIARQVGVVEKKKVQRLVEEFVKEVDAAMANVHDVDSQALRAAAREQFEDYKKVCLSLHPTLSFFQSVQM